MEDVPGLHDIAGLIRHAAEDEKISGILIENGLGGLRHSSAKVILDALKEFKESDLPQVLRIWQVIQSGEPQARLPFGFKGIE